MKRLIHLFSLAVATQIVLMLSQLILLPIQLRLWGQQSTALWYSALALATVTYVVDCGLRTAGHSELMQASATAFKESVETNDFRQIWGWIRVLVVAITAGLIFLGFAGNRLAHWKSYQPWQATLTLACALETLLVIRITYLDSLGKYRGAEASYFCLALLRLSLSIPALLVLHWNATGLAGIYLFSSVAALAAQGQLLCRSIPLLQLTDKFPKLSWSSLATARHTIAEPLANWTRLSLPVLVIAQVASPLAVTTYVALRAVFGAGRTTIQQLARVASVEFLKFRTLGQPKQAESLFTLLVVAAGFFGAVVGSTVVMDNARIMGLWLKHLNRNVFQEIVIAFAATAPFFSYQIPMSLMFRTGQLAWVARRHYSFVACSLLFAGLTLFARSLPFYLALTVTAEAALSISFFAPGKARTILSESDSGKAGLRVAVAGSLTVCLVWLLVRKNVFNAFVAIDFWTAIKTFGLLSPVVAIAAVLVYRRYPRHLLFVEGHNR